MTRHAVTVVSDVKGRCAARESALPAVTADLKLNRQYTYYGTQSRGLRKKHEIKKYLIEEEINAFPSNN